MSKSVTIALIAAALLVGCSTGPEDKETKKAGGCPSGALLAEAASVTKFNAAGHDPADVVLTAEMTKPKVTCSFDAGTRQVQISIKFPMNVKRGPAGNDASVTLAYFVAMVDLDNTVVMKKDFTRGLTLDEPTGDFSESPDDISFVVPKDKKPVGYEVLIGFQLTHDELAYNRAQHHFVP